MLLDFFCKLWKIDADRRGGLPIKAVAFDVDGTLYPNASMVWRSAPMVFANLFLFKALETARLELRNHPQHLPDVHTAQAEIVARILRLPTEEVRLRIEKLVYTRWYQVFHRLKPYAGLIPLLQRLRAHGYPLVVMSDFPIRGRLEALGLAKYFDWSFSSQPFFQISERLGLPVSDILYVGNSVTYDVDGAHAAGMPCAHLVDGKRHATTALLTFRTYSELEAYLFPGGTA